MFNLTRIFFFVLIVSASLGRVVAQDAEKTYVFSLLLLSDRPLADGDHAMGGVNLSFLTEAEVYQVALERNTLSRKFQYKGGSEIGFFRDAAQARAETGGQAVFTVELGTPGEKVIIVSDTSGKGMSANVLDVSRSTFPENTLRVLNFSNQVTFAKVDDSTAEIQPNEMHDYSLDGRSPRSVFAFELAIAAIDEGETYLLEKRRMTAKQGGRKMILVHNQRQNFNRLTYKVFDIKPQAEVKNVSDRDLKSVDTSKYYRLNNEE
ncbi:MULTISPECIES: hypothetical protein [unclassified Lentimonas]|uniref:hypothetical protein n=1 Tax=unclassified Lentimonas TaxID=2630993 RepID=UPI0013264AA3|nr:MULTISPECIES: hypothetical protein [unclassified Lentimonas]CAA6692405.1 Unannotated [Lentimonas sp. CC19]CAA6693986.1 Unannotated [Lentimonas sp. CC10]CAA7072223.1 Unannotated [Lentimonas sp. CC11]